MSAVAEPIQAAFGTPKPRKDGAEEFWTDFGFTRSIVQDGPTIADIETDVEAEAAFYSELRSGNQSAKWPDAKPKAAKGDALLRGYANTWVEDRDFEMVGRHAFDRTLESYLKKNPIILLQHDHRQVLGQTHEAETDDTGLAMVGHVRQPQPRDPDWKHGAFNDIKAGIYRTFSIGGFFWRELVEGFVIITEIDLFEISVVAVPSNPDSIFEAAAKSLGRGAGRLMGKSSDLGRVLSQMRQLQGMEPDTDPQVMRMDLRARQTRYAELSAQYVKATGAQPPAWGVWDGIVQATLDASLPYGLLATQAERAVKALYEVPTVPELLGGGKAGRVLSKSNEKKIRGAADRIKEAAESLQAVLDQVITEEPDEAQRSMRSTGGKALNSEVQARLRQAGVERWGKKDTYVWIDDYDVDEKWAVFAVEGKDDYKLLKVKFTLTDDGCDLSSEEDEVIRTASYAPKSA